MLQKNRRVYPRAARVALFAGALTLTTSLSGFGQNPTPTTPPSSSQTGTTAAPGTAPIHSRVVARSLAPQRVATYNEKFELFGGLSFMNGQAGQNLPKRYNMGGGEVMGTYWLGRHLGAAADYRFEAGTTPVLPAGAAFGLNRVLVYQSIFSGGVEYRGPKNRYVAIDYHALAGATHGTFNTAVLGYPQNLTPQPTDSLIGLYNNRTSPWAAAGGSIDFNQSPRLAVRLSPDMIFEHFGTETREFFSIGGGVIYRFGRR